MSPTKLPNIDVQDLENTLSTYLNVTLFAGGRKVANLDKNPNTPINSQFDKIVSNGIMSLKRHLNIWINIYTFINVLNL